MFEVKGLALSFLKYLSTFDDSISEGKLLEEFIGYYKEDEFSKEKKEAKQFLQDNGYIYLDSYGITITTKGKDYIKWYDDLMWDDVSEKDLYFAILKFLYLYKEQILLSSFPNSLVLNTPAGGKSTNILYNLGHYIQFDSDLTKYVEFNNQIQSCKIKEAGIRHYEHITREETKLSKEKELEAEIKRLTHEHLLIQSTNAALSKEVQDLQVELSKAQIKDIPKNADFRDNVLFWQIATGVCTILAFLLGLFSARLLPD